MSKANVYIKVDYADLFCDKTNPLSKFGQVDHISVLNNFRSRYLIQYLITIYPNTSPLLAINLLKLSDKKQFGILKNYYIDLIRVLFENAFFFDTYLVFKIYALYSIDNELTDQRNQYFDANQEYPQYVVTYPQIGTDALVYSNFVYDTTLAADKNTYPLYRVGPYIVSLIKERDEPMSLSNFIMTDLTCATAVTKDGQVLFNPISNNDDFYIDGGHEWFIQPDQVPQTYNTFTHKYALKNKLVRATRPTYIDPTGFTYDFNFTSPNATYTLLYAASLTDESLKSVMEYRNANDPLITSTLSFTSPDLGVFTSAQNFNLEWKNISNILKDPFHMFFFHETYPFFVSKLAAKPHSTIIYDIQFQEKLTAPPIIANIQGTRRSMWHTDWTWFQAEKMNCSKYSLLYSDDNIDNMFYIAQQEPLQFNDDVVTTLRLGQSHNVDAIFNIQNALVPTRKEIIPIDLSQPNPYLAIRLEFLSDSILINNCNIFWSTEIVTKNDYTYIAEKPNSNSIINFTTQYVALNQYTQPVNNFQMMFIYQPPNALINISPLLSNFIKLNVVDLNNMQIIDGETAYKTITSITTASTFNVCEGWHFVLSVDLTNLIPTGTNYAITIQFEYVFDSQQPYDLTLLSTGTYDVVTFGDIDTSVATHSIFDSNSSNSRYIYLPLPLQQFLPLFYILNNIRNNLYQIFVECRLDTRPRSYIFQQFNYICAQVVKQNDYALSSRHIVLCDSIVRNSLTLNAYDLIGCSWEDSTSVWWSPFIKTDIVTFLINVDFSFTSKNFDSNLLSTNITNPILFDPTLIGGIFDFNLPRILILGFL